jgi:hypothetical protein
MTKSFSSNLSGITVQYTCERNGYGGVGQVMSYGNGSITGKGLRMPRSGRMFYATLSGAFVIGTTTFKAYLNSKTQDEYCLSANGEADDIGVTKDWSDLPLCFNEGDVLGWIHTEAPHRANTMNISYFVMFD